MRGGANRKTIEQHLADGTYRGSRHGRIIESDDKTLRRMKEDLYNDYCKITGEIRKLKIPGALEEYAKMNRIRLDYVKAYHSIAKTPALDSANGAGEDTPDDKFGFKNRKE